MCCNNSWSNWNNGCNSSDWSNWANNSGCSCNRSNWENNSSGFHRSDWDNSRSSCNGTRWSNDGRFRCCRSSWSNNQSGGRSGCTHWVRRDPNSRSGGCEWFQVRNSNWDSDWSNDSNCGCNF